RQHRLQRGGRLLRPPCRSPGAPHRAGRRLFGAGGPLPDTGRDDRARAQRAAGLRAGGANARALGDREMGGRASAPWGARGRRGSGDRPERRAARTISSVSATGTVAGSSGTKKNNRSKPSANSPVKAAAGNWSERPAVAASRAPSVAAMNRSP